MIGRAPQKKMPSLSNKYIVTLADLNQLAALSIEEFLIPWWPAINDIRLVIYIFVIIKDASNNNRHNFLIHQKYVIFRRPFVLWWRRMQNICAGNVAWRHKVFTWTRLWSTHVLFEMLKTEFASISLVCITFLSLLIYWSCIFIIYAVLHIVICTYRKISNIRRTSSPNLNVCHLVLQMYLPNPLKPGVKSRMKM